MLEKEILKKAEQLIKSVTKAIVLSEEPNLDAWENLRDALANVQQARLILSLTE